MRPPRNYWYINTTDTGMGYSVDLVRVQWDQEDWRVPWLYRARAPRAQRGKPVLVPSDSQAFDLALNWFVPRLRDHDLLYLRYAKQFRRVGDLLAQRDARRLSKAAKSRKRATR